MGPGTGDLHIRFAHLPVVRVGPAAEGVAIGHVAVGVFHFHHREAGVVVVDLIRLAFHQAGDGLGQVDSLGDLAVPAVVHAVLRHFHFRVGPAAGDVHAFGLHDAVVRVGPAAESVAVGHVAVGVFHFHHREAGVVVVDLIRLAFHQAGDGLGQVDSLGDLAVPAVVHAVLRHFHFRVGPAAGDVHAFGLHDAVVRVGPAAESVAVGHVAVGIFFHHYRGAGVLGVDGVRLTEFHSLVSRLRHAIGRAGPAVGYLVVLGLKMSGIDGVSQHFLRSKGCTFTDFLTILIRPFDELIAGFRDGNGALSILARVDGLIRRADTAVGAGHIGDSECFYLPLGVEGSICIDRGNGRAGRIGNAFPVRLGVPADELVVGLCQPVVAGHRRVILALDQNGAFGHCAHAAVGVIADGDQIRGLLVHIDPHHIVVNILLQGTGLPLNGVEAAVFGEVIAPHLLGQLSGAVIVLIVVQSGPVDVLIFGVEARVAAGIACIQLHGKLIGLDVAPHRVKDHVLCGHIEGITRRVLRGRGVFVLSPAQERVTVAGQGALRLNGDQRALDVLTAIGHFAGVLPNQRIRIVSYIVFVLIQDHAVHMVAIILLFDDIPKDVLGGGVIGLARSLHCLLDLVIGRLFVQIILHSLAGGINHKLALLNGFIDYNTRSVILAVIFSRFPGDRSVQADEEGRIRIVSLHPNGVESHVMRRQNIGIAGGVNGLFVVFGRAVVGSGGRAPSNEALAVHRRQGHRIAGFPVHRRGGSAGAAVGGVDIIGKGDLGRNHGDGVCKFLRLPAKPMVLMRHNDGGRSHCQAGHFRAPATTFQRHNALAAGNAPAVAHTDASFNGKAFVHFYGLGDRIVIGAAGQGRGHGLGHIVADGAEGADLQRADARLGGLQGAVRLLVEHDDGLVFARFGQRHGHGDRLFGLHGGALGVHDGDIIDH